MIAAIEDAIITRIVAAAAATPGLGYKLNKIASYGGELDEELTRVVPSFPAIWVTFGGIKSSTKMNTSGTKWKTSATFVTLAGSRNMRGERSTRHGTKVAGVLKEVGTYQMLKDVCTMVLGSDLGLAITKLEPGSVRTLRHQKGISVLAREWHTTFVESVPREVFDPSHGDFLKLGIDYYLQPDDGVADASAVITL
ncbi:MAG: phage protein Gp37 [Gallionellaceae bacterium]|jgi:phage gp37-like protein